MPLFPVTFSVNDSFNGSAQKTWVVDALDHVAAKAAADALFSDYDAIQTGGIQKYVVKEEILVGNAADAGSNRDEGVTITMDLGAGKTAPLKVPMPDKTFVNPDRSVDLQSAEWIAFLDNWISGGWTISDGETALGAKSGTLDK